MFYYIGVVNVKNKEYIELVYTILLNIFLNIAIGYIMKKLVDKLRKNVANYTEDNTRNRSRIELYYQVV
jgi:hypothetical protein